MKNPTILLMRKQIQTLSHENEILKEEHKQYKNKNVAELVQKSIEAKNKYEALALEITAYRDEYTHLVAEQKAILKELRTNYQKQK